MAGFSARSSAAIDLSLVPYPAVTLIFGLGGQIDVEAPTLEAVHGSVVVGIGATGVRGRARAVECLQVRLAAPLAYAVFGGPTGLPGAVTTLDTLIGHRGTVLEECLRTAVTWDERFAMAQAELTRRWQDSRHTADPEIMFAWRRLRAARGRQRVDALANEFGWSRQRLWSRFRAQIGLTPKRAAQLIRFDWAAHRLAAGRSPGDVAAECGYADQSHLHRDTRSFAELTPMSLATAPWLAVDEVAWPSR
jgi:AraC-like DNA-binding protein